MENQPILVKKRSFASVMSGTLMITGTAIGAGMLGIPLLTSQAGFWPSFVVTACVWLFMLATGLLFLEVSLWMPEGSNILSMAQRFLGNKGKVVAGFMFIFLYYCLMVAYYAAGAPLISDFLKAFGLHLPSSVSYALFGLIFALVVGLGARAINRVNTLLTIAMVVDYFLMVWVGSSEVEMSRLEFSKWSAVAISVPVLFSAFGYHNVIPSLCNYLKRERKVLQTSIILGTTIPFVLYVVWQWLMIGASTPEAIAAARAAGLPATEALKGASSLYLVGQYFAFFAIVTSLLGVAFSLVDFLADGIKIKQTKASRSLLTFLTFFPPFLFVVFDPHLFETALGVAGGFGEAFLNGLLPVMLVWMGRYALKLPSDCPLPGGRISLFILSIISFLVIVLEAIFLFKA